MISSGEVTAVSSISFRDIMHVGVGVGVLVSRAVTTRRGRRDSRSGGCVNAKPRSLEGGELDCHRHRDQTRGWCISLGLVQHQASSDPDCSQRTCRVPTRIAATVHHLPVRLGGWDSTADCHGPVLCLCLSSFFLSSTTMRPRL